MEITIKKLYELAGSPFVLDTAMTYPTIPESEANFLTDYNTNKAQYDRYFLKEHGNKIVDIDGEDEEDIVLNWKNEIQAIQRIYLDAWAHMYYALDIAYNPVYNVEEHTTSTYGLHETEREYGQHQTESQYGIHETEREYGATQDTIQYGATQDTTQYGATKLTKEFGATSDTLGTHTDTRTNYSVSMDDAAEKETGKQTDVIGSQTNTSLLHTDTEDTIQHSDIASSLQHSDISSSLVHTDTETDKAHTDTVTSKLHTDTETSKQHIDSVDRTGNIGIKSASALAQEEVLLRERNIFFKGIFLTISREVGAYYDYNFI